MLSASIAKTEQIETRDESRVRENIFFGSFICHFSQHYNPFHSHA